MEDAQIKYRFADIGHWVARCDHTRDVIELNEKEFWNLSPLFQEYVWIHECVHLLMDVYDEARCNAIVDKVFLSRAVSAKDKVDRMNFIGKSNSIMMSGTSLKKEERKARVSFLAILIALAIVLTLTKS